MPNEPYWVTPEGVAQLNRRAVADTGEPFQIRSLELLESACERPKNHWHYTGCEDIVELGCLLLLGIARNHPFIQGNKRAAYSAMIGFFGANGYRLLISDHVPNADFIDSAIQGLMPDDEFVEAIRAGVERVGR